MAKNQMTKAEMIDQIAKEAGISKTQSKAAIDSFIGMCSKEVKGGRSFRVSGLGTFSLKKNKARKGRNPQTGEVIKIKASKSMGFKPSSQIKALLNPKKK